MINCSRLHEASNAMLLIPITNNTTECFNFINWSRLKSWPRLLYKHKRILVQRIHLIVNSSFSTVWFGFWLALGRHFVTYPQNNRKVIRLIDNIPVSIIIPKVMENCTRFIVVWYSGVYRLFEVRGCA